MLRYYFVALIVILIDQMSKWIIVQQMELAQSIQIIHNFFYITSHRNEGAAWGILQGQMTFFYFITVIVVVAIVYYMQRYGNNHPLLATSLSLLLGGAIGNFIDRLFRKEVVDFLDFIIISYDFPIFNIADSALTIGVILLIIFTLFEDKLLQKRNEVR